MKLADIENKVSNLPTIMDLVDEVLIIDALMCIDEEHLRAHIPSFSKIVYALELSHSDSGFMEVTAENEEDVLRFYRWLKKLQSHGFGFLNDSIIETFNFSADEVKELMSPR